MGRGGGLPGLKPEPGLGGREIQSERWGMIVGTVTVRRTEWTLGRLASEAGYALAGDPSVGIAGVTEDSRQCRAGDLFVALAGTRDDGLRYARDAAARGAAAIAEERDPGAGMPWLRVPDARASAGRLADLVYGDPSRELQLVGVTGTNGKTTTAHLIAQLVPGQAGFIGTTGIRYPGREAPSANTTPSEMRSAVESKNAPNRVAILARRARMPSKRSRPPASRYISPASSKSPSTISQAVIRLSRMPISET